nr:virulence-associated E family protein [Prevotella sp.]
MKKSNLHGEALGACAEEMLLIEQFVNEYYLLRRNVLSGKVEFATKSEDGQFGDFQPLTKSAMNSIVIHAKKIGLFAKKSPRQGIQEFLESDEIPTFSPIEDFLNQLPKWDGHNYVGDLFARIPGLSTEQTDLLCIWFRAMMAQCLQMNTLHANETVPTLIGDQGCGKTTF